MWTLTLPTPVMEMEIIMAITMETTIKEMFNLNLQIHTFLLIHIIPPINILKVETPTINNMNKMETPTINNMNKVETLTINNMNKATTINNMKKMKNCNSLYIMIW